MRLANPLFSVQRLHQRDRGAEERHDEARVASAGAKAGRLRFKDCDFEPRVGRLEMIGSRQPREAAADHRNIDLDIA